MATPAASPRFTCVIPAFDRQHTVGRAIQSALDQSLPPAEVVVVDDGSTDGTRGAIEAFGDRVRYVHQENAGGAAARNRGAREATAEWIAFLDSDDYWNDGHLEAMAAAITGTNGAADFYFGDLRRTGVEGGHRQWEQARFSIDEAWRLIDDATSLVVRARMPMMLQGTVFHRQRFLAKGGLWDELRRRHDTHGFVVHGVGHPACAVRHVGTVMTADDDAGRLSDVMNYQSRGYLSYSVMLWSDLLGRFPELPRVMRRALSYRLMIAYVRLARVDLRERRLGAFVGHLARAVATHPGLFLARVFGSELDEWAVSEDVVERAAVPSEA